MSSYHSDVAGEAEYLWQRFVTTDGGDAHELAWALCTAGTSYSRRGEHDAAIESSERAVRLLRDRIDHSVGTEDDESSLPWLLSNLADAHANAQHPAERLAAWSEAVQMQRRLHPNDPNGDDNWVLADLLHGYADAALDLGFESEARSSLREAQELLAGASESRQWYPKEILRQVEVTRMKLRSP